MRSGLEAKTRGHFASRSAASLDLPVSLARAHRASDDDLALLFGARIVEAVSQRLVDLLGVAVDAGEAAVRVGDVDCPREC